MGQKKETFLNCRSKRAGRFLFHRVSCVAASATAAMWSSFKKSLDSIRDQALQAYDEAIQPVQSRRNLGQAGSASFGSSGGNVVQFKDRSVRLLDQIAEGGYSTVFLGEEVLVGAPGASYGTGYAGSAHERSIAPRRYAVKRIACGGREQLSEAKKEIDVMERLGGVGAANVLPLIGYTRTRCDRPGDLEYVYMLFDLYDGNLWDVVESRIRVGRYLGEDELGGVFRQLCLALDAMHAAGMAHRDVKPHNVLLKDVDSYPYGKWSKVSAAPAMLMDFGSVTEERVVITDRLGALQTQENAERHTTAPYRAPELWDVGSSCVIDGKVDVWAAGCVLYYMMVGETPFERISNQAGGSLMLSVLNGSYTWPENLEVSSKYAEIVRACLAVDPATRPTIGGVMAMIDGEAAVGNAAGSVACEARAVVAEARPPTVIIEAETEQKADCQSSTGMSQPSAVAAQIPNLIDL